MSNQDDIHIVVLDRDTFPKEVTIAGPAQAHTFTVYGHTAPEQVADRIADADIVITNKVGISSDALAGSSRLKMIAIAATGYDIVDVGACSARGIVVSNVRNYAVHTVPEHTFALMLALRRNLLAYHTSVMAGRWQESGQFCYFDYPIRDLAGSTLGIIGDGAIGQAVATIARAFGMTVLFAARKGSSPPGKLYTPFEEVLERADIISLHVPLRDDTRHMIGFAEFAQMRRRPLIINTGRGGLIDEADLERALISGQISGAGIDVVSSEPMPHQHPFHSLMQRHDFILTPHIAWASQEATQAVSTQVTENIEAFLAGMPQNVVG